MLLFCASMINKTLLFPFINLNYFQFTLVSEHKFSKISTLNFPTQMLEIFNFKLSKSNQMLKIFSFKLLISLFLIFEQTKFCHLQSLYSRAPKSECLDFGGRWNRNICWLQFHTIIIIQKLNIFVRFSDTRLSLGH